MSKSPYTTIWDWWDAPRADVMQHLIRLHSQLGAMTALVGVYQEYHPSEILEKEIARANELLQKAPSPAREVAA